MNGGKRSILTDPRSCSRHWANGTDNVALISVAYSKDSSPSSHPMAEPAKILSIAFGYENSM
jgi:hypothetical protein